MSRRLGSAIVALLAVVASLVVVSTPAQAATVAHGASTSHPYSNPSWWPLAAGSSTNSSVGPKFDCYKGNSGCPGYHTYWGLDLRVTDYDNKVPVYAMGAGVAHLGTTGHVCSSNEKTGAGNYIWIDHGAGVISFYEHLGSKPLITNGEYVSARTPIGYAGNTGYAQCATNKNLRYVFVAITHSGVTTPTTDDVHFTHLYACVDGARQEWPQDLPGHSWTDLNQIPRKTVMPVADSSRSCIAAPPATASRPSGIALKSYSSGVRAYWNKPSTSYRVSSGHAELQLYHPSITKYLDERTASVKPTSTRITWLSLKANHRYRFRLFWYNSSGYSAGTSWVYLTLPK